MSTPTYPLAKLAAQITPTGISAPDLDAIIDSDIATYQGIYGSDVVLTDETQDYQLLATRCAAINDCNQMAIAVYNSFLPSYAQGVGLSALVVLNGLTREIATNSTVVLNLVGQAGIVITAGIVADPSGNLWNLPTDITIPDSGKLTVTATAQQPGAISLPANSELTTYTIVPGWQSVTNPSGATPGAAIETDAALRVRQTASTALPAQTPLDSILAAVANSGGIGRYTIYENDTNATDDNGVPSHSVAVVVEGGDVTTIATVIAKKKAPGTGTYGTTSVGWVDQAGIPNTINFFECTETPIYAAITIQPLAGYVSTTGAAAVAALVAFLEALEIGEEVYLSWLYGVVGLSGNPLSQTFVITSLLIGTSPDNLSAANIPIAFNAAANCATANVTLTVA